MESPKKIKQNNHDFYENFKIKHADKIKEKIICPICNGTYTYFNKSTHNKTKHHKNILELGKGRPFLSLDEMSRIKHIFITNYK